MDAVNAPAAKRSRGDSDKRSRDEMAMFNESVRDIFLSLLYFLTFRPFSNFVNFALVLTHFNGLWYALYSLFIWKPSN